MLKKEIKYLDYFTGEEETAVAYFNLNEAEIVRLDVQFRGGLRGYIGNFDAQNRPEDVLNLFEKVMSVAYGEKSPDGKFVKDADRTKAFMDSAPYSALFVELLQDAEAAAAFFSAVLSTTAVGEIVQPATQKN